MSKISPIVCRIEDGDLYCDVRIDHASGLPGKPPVYEIAQEDCGLCLTRSMIEHLLKAIDMIER